MMDVVIYGIIPRARTENLLNAPPLKVLIKSKSPPPDSNTEAIQELNRLVHAEPRVSAVLLTIRDGVFLIKPRVSNDLMKQAVPGRK